MHRRYNVSESSSVLPSVLRTESFLSSMDFHISRFGFEGRTLALIAPVPGHCLL